MALNRLTISQRLDAIEKDRNSLSAIGVKASAAAGLKILSKIVIDYKENGPGSISESKVTDLFQQFVKPILVDAMVAARLSGESRTRAFAIAYRASVGGSQMSSAYDEAIEKLRKRLRLTLDQILTLQEEYADPVAASTATLGESVARGVQSTILQSVAKGDSVSQGIKAIRTTFEDEGVSPAASYKLEAVYRTATQQAYAAGRWKAMQDPDVKPLIKGLQYCAIEDDRTTELCESLDGTVLPVDDPFWSKYMPPNHWNCRATVLEVYNDEDIDEQAPPEDLESPPEGFDVNFGKEEDPEDDDEPEMMSNPNHDERGRFVSSIGEDVVAY